MLGQWSFPNVKSCMHYLSIPKGDGCVITLEKRYLYSFATDFDQGFFGSHLYMDMLFQVSGLGVPANTGFWNLSSLHQLGFLYKTKIIYFGACDEY